MKRVKFTLSIGFQSKHESILEFDDAITEEEIAEEYQIWCQNYLDGDWRILDEQDRL